MTIGYWAETRKFYMDGLAKAKQDGIVNAVGVSCHNWDAMVEAVDNPWCDVILARLNPFQSHMDGTTEAVNELLGKARKKGKGLIGIVGPVVIALQPIDALERHIRRQAVDLAVVTARCGAFACDRRLHGQIQAGQVITQTEHPKHIRLVGCIKVTEIQSGQAVAAGEHESHVRYFGGIKAG